MKSDPLHFFHRHKPAGDLVVLLADSHPDPALLETLAKVPSLALRESFSTQGALQALPGANLVILGEVVPLPGLSTEILTKTLGASGIPVVSVAEFLEQPDEWLSRARLAGARQVNSARAAVNLVNWSGWVGKTTFVMALCKRFVERTSLPVAPLR